MAFATLLASLALSLQAGAPAGTVLESGPGHVQRTTVGPCFTVYNWYDRHVRSTPNPAGKFFVISRSVVRRGC